MVGIFEAYRHWRGIALVLAVTVSGTVQQPHQYSRWNLWANETCARSPQDSSVSQTCFSLTCGEQACGGQAVGDSFCCSTSPSWLCTSNGWGGMVEAPGQRPKLQRPSDRSDPRDDGNDLGMLGETIDNRQIYNRFLQAGIQLLEQHKKGEGQGLLFGEIQETIVQKNRRPAPAVPRVGLTDPMDSRQRYQAMVRSSLLLGTIYDCGRCDNLHANIAGGVVISDDGLALTNYHVLEREESGVELLTAMTYEGQSRPILEILSTDREADVALIRLGGDPPFYPAPLARQAPFPTETVRVLSHPSNEYFVLTEGEVSRHVRFRGRRGGGEWMEITASFGGGSSGSAVFNEHGEVVGLVSRIHPLFRKPKATGETEQEDETPSNNTSNGYVEMVIRRCVPLSALERCFRELPDDESSNY